MKLSDKYALNIDVIKGKTTMKNPIAEHDSVLPLAHNKPSVLEGRRKGCSIFVNENPTSLIDISKSIRW